MSVRVATRLAINNTVGWPFGVHSTIWRLDVEMDVRGPKIAFSALPNFSLMCSILASGCRPSLLGFDFDNFRPQLIFYITHPVFGPVPHPDPLLSILIAFMLLQDIYSSRYQRLKTGFWVIFGIQAPSFVFFMK